MQVQRAAQSDQKINPRVGKTTKSSGAPAQRLYSMLKV